MGEIRRKIGYCRGVSIAMLQQQLSTPQGFAAAVKKKQPLLSGGLTSLALAAGGVAMNLFQLGSASDWNWRLMFRYFFDAGAIEFTGARSGRAEMWHFLYVWGPVVLLPLGIILLILHFARRNNTGAKLFDEYQQRGWIGSQAPLVLSVKEGNNDVSLALIGRADGPVDELQYNATQFNQWASSLDKKALKQTSVAAVKAGVLKGGIPAQEVAPAFPQGTLVSRQLKTQLVIVIPPAEASKKAVVLELKN